MNHVFAIPGDYNTWSAFTVILELLGLFLSHAGEFDQCLRSLDYYLPMSQKSAADSYGVDMLDERIFAYLLGVW